MKIFNIFLGLLALGFGAIGALIPMLPTFPFLMLAAFCFARSSKKLDTWFRSTRLYRNNLADFAAGRGMPKAAKIRIMVTVTVLMSVGFVMMDTVPLGRILLSVIWIFHVIYFLFGIKTIPTAPKETPV